VQPTEHTPFFHTNLFLSNTLENTVVIPLSAVFSAGGRVVDQTGKVVSQVELILSKVGDEGQSDLYNAVVSPPVIMQRMFTDVNGNFKFNGLVKGEYVVFARHDKYAPTCKTFRIKDKDIEMAGIILGSGEKIKGCITDSDDNPVSNIVVYLKDSELKRQPYSPWSTFLSTLTDTNGGFAFNRLEQDNYKIELYENRDTTLPIAVLDNIKSGGEQVHISIERGIPCLCQVIDSSNKPVGNVIFDIELVSELGLKKLGSIDMTDTDGVFTRALRENAVYRFSFFKYGYLPTNALIDTAEASSASGISFKIAMERGNSLSGQVLDGCTRKPAGKGLMVVSDLWNLSAFDWQATNMPYITDENGCFNLDGLSSGAIQIAIYKLNKNLLPHCIGKSDVIINFSKTNFLNIHLPTLGGITGMVTYLSNEPVKRGKIMLLSEEDSTARVKYYEEILDGSFKVDEVLPGKYKIFFWLFQTGTSNFLAAKESLIFSWKDIIQVNPGETNTLNVLSASSQSEAGTNAIVSMEKE
jgi:hypothetical protein